MVMGHSQRFSWVEMGPQIHVLVVVLALLCVLERRRMQVDFRGRSVAHH